MGFDDGSVILDSANGAYYAGQTIYGRIVFDQGKPKTIHGIYVSCKGYCKVHWTTHRKRRVNERDVTETINHDSYEEYFKRKTFIVGDADGEHHLQKGHHEFRFDCPIPNNCPSSFEGSHGHIRYRVKVVMVTTGIFSSNKEKLVAIRVHAPLDLNQNPNCREPIESVILSNYCCWCMSSGSSEVRVKLPVSGYCAGQVIPMEVSVQNNSSVEIDELIFAIKKIVKYEAMHAPGTKQDSDTICEMKKGPIPGGTTRNWTLEMEVPAMDIYNVNACRFIDMTYYFEVNTSTGACHEDGEDSHLIIFGTVPLVGFQDKVENPLRDQLPKPIEVQNSQNSNCYPPPPIMSQPLPSPYPNGNYPQNTPYPGGAYPTPPNIAPYPQPGPPTVSPYPNNSPYPQTNPGYPNSTPYPPGPQSTPSPAPGYPGHSPSPYPQGPMGTPNPGNAYPSNNPPGSYSTPSSAPGYLGPPAHSPYPPGHMGTPNSAPGFQGSSPAPPYPGGNAGTIGFVAVSGDPATVPLLPLGHNAPYPIVSSPYQKASAPEPSTPADETKSIEMHSPSPAYNPEFMKSENKDEK